MQRANEITADLKPIGYQDRAYLQHLQRETITGLQREALERIVKTSLDEYSRKVAQQTIDRVREIERHMDGQARMRGRKA